MEKFLNFLKNPITISILVLVIGVLGIWGLINAIPKSQVEKGPKVEHTWGKQDSKVVIEVYSDFQCPGCKYFWDNVEGQLKQKYEGQVKFIYRHYPLSFHTKADDAAEASEAAAEQGKFFEYADILFNNQPDQSNLGSWTDSVLIDYARQIQGLDIAKFEESFKSGKYEAVVDDYISEGNSKGVDSTPTLYINGKEIRGANNTIADLATIEAEIQKVIGAPTPTPTPSK